MKKILIQKHTLVAINAGTMEPNTELLFLWEPKRTKITSFFNNGLRFPHLLYSCGIVQVYLCIRARLRGPKGPGSLASHHPGVSGSSHHILVMRCPTLSLSPVCSLLCLNRDCKIRSQLIKSLAQKRRGLGKVTFALYHTRRSTGSRFNW